MKKSIKTIGTIATMEIMLVCAFWLGNVTANKKVDAETKTETKKIMPQEKGYPEQRVMCGNYYDYLVVETIDGNEWLLDDTADSPYIENDIAVFGDGELVQVVFDTKGTETITDDEILEVRSIDWRHK